MSGESSVVVAARRALLDALEAMAPHLDSLILVGAQAVYLHSSEVKSPVAAYTKDADLSLDTRTLAQIPLVEVAMTEAGFAIKDPGQPGGWWSSNEVRVDLMVPEGIAGKGTRGVTMPPHDRRSARNTKGIEGCLVDNAVFSIGSYDQKDSRRFNVKVAGPASLIVAKVYKINDRVSNPKRRMEDKDAHDVYRLLRAVNSEQLVQGFRVMLNDAISRDVVIEGLRFLKILFADDPTAEGSLRAGRAEYGVGQPDTVAQSVTTLAGELLQAIKDANLLVM